MLKMFRLWKMFHQHLLSWCEYKSKWDPKTNSSFPSNTLCRRNNQEEVNNSITELQHRAEKADARYIKLQFKVKCIDLKNTVAAREGKWISRTTKAQAQTFFSALLLRASRMLLITFCEICWVMLGSST